MINVKPSFVVEYFRWGGKDHIWDEYCNAWIYGIYVLDVVSEKRGQMISGRDY